MRGQRPKIDHKKYLLDYILIAISVLLLWFANVLSQKTINIYVIIGLGILGLAVHRILQKLEVDTKIPEYADDEDPDIRLDKRIGILILIVFCVISFYIFPELISLENCIPIIRVILFLLIVSFASSILITGLIEKIFPKIDNSTKSRDNIFGMFAILLFFIFFYIIKIQLFENKKFHTKNFKVHTTYRIHPPNSIQLLAIDSSRWLHIDSTELVAIKNCQVIQVKGKSILGMFDYYYSFQCAEQ